LMRTTFYPKFQYVQAIKRIAINLELTTWESFSQTIIKAFNIPSKQEIYLTYIDSDNDEVTINNNSDLKTNWSVVCSDNPPVFSVHLSDKLEKFAKKIHEANHKPSTKAKHRKNVYSEFINWVPQAGEDEFEQQDKLYESTIVINKASIELSKEDVMELVEEIFLIPQVQKKVEEKLGKFREKYAKEFALKKLNKDVEFCVNAEKISQEKIAQVVSSSIKQALQQANSLKKAMANENVIEKDRELLQQIRSNYQKEKSLLQEELSLKKKSRNESNQYMDCGYKAGNYGANFVVKTENGKSKLYAVQDKEYEFIKSQIMFEQSLYESMISNKSILKNK